jgi:transposase-like protein
MNIQSPKGVSSSWRKGVSSGCRWTHGTYPIAFKRQVAQEFLAGEVSLFGLAKRHDICRNLIRVWVEKYERGEFDSEMEAANLLEHYEARAGLTSGERRQALGDHRPDGLSVAEGCRLMGLARSTSTKSHCRELDETALVERMHAIRGEFPMYGYRRMAAQLRAEGMLVNRKRVARLMRLHAMQVRPRRRYVTTTDSAHDGPIFPNLAKDMAPDRPEAGLFWMRPSTALSFTSKLGLL